MREDSGMVSLLIERAQGLLGEVGVEWRTEDGTASSDRNQDYIVSTISAIV